MKREPLRVGFIGYGAIGQGITHLIAERAVTDILLIGALVRHPTKYRSESIPIVETLSKLLDEHPHVIVEVAGHDGLHEHGVAILRAGIDLLLVSVGALAEPDFFQKLLDAAQAGGVQIQIASGAIGALDALSSASLGEISSVIHTLRKPPSTLLTPEEARNITTEQEVFRGKARQAVLKFPEFLNVAAAVALATTGFDQMEVRVVADPAVRHSLHEIKAEGAFGRLRFEIENEPISRLPARGARLVAMSVVHSLLLRNAPLLIG